MRFFHLAALVALIAVALSLPASGRSLGDVDHNQYFTVKNQATAPAARTDADGNEVSCSSTLQARCIGGSTWKPVSGPLALECPRTEPGVEYREPILDILENTEWSCSPTASGAPAEAIRGKQLVEVRGTLSSCAASTLTAQSSCTYDCLDDDGSIDDCEESL